MSDIHEKGSDAGSGSDYTGTDAPVVIERPKGIRGLYSHPVTQVGIFQRSLLFTRLSANLLGCFAWFRLLHVSR
jgi:hypothetical protein